MNDNVSDEPVGVSELSRRVRSLLEHQIGTVWVVGEISNFSRPRSGHWYFTLKDDSAQLRCAMFAGRNRLVRFDVAEGMQVLARGRVSLYEARGDFQLIIENLRLDGEGALRAAFEALRDKLAGEGLFAPDLKRELPAFPKRLALITSATGAARRDVESVLARRFPALEVVLLPVSVQGDAAGQEVVSALARLPEIDCDVALITRGGGAIEDLWTFNLESVARAISASPVPIVSAIGHETDITIADLVADMRAPTPSAAAELIVPDRADILAWLGERERRLGSLLQRRLEWDRQRVSQVSRRLRHPRQVIEHTMQRLDDLDRRLQRAQIDQLAQSSNRLSGLAGRARQASPERLLTSAADRLNQLRDRLQRATNAQSASAATRLGVAERALNAVSPLATLERGYAIVSAPGDGRYGAPITQRADLHPGTVVAHFADGSAELTVTTVTDRDERNDD